jgi:four helix bundle protein
MIFSFEKLEVWQKAIEYATFMYEITRRFPSNERYGLTSQIRRAAVSISSNIAEGSSRSSEKEFARFVEMAYESLMETVSQTEVAMTQEWIETNDYNALLQLADRLARMLSGLRSSLLKRSNS